MYYNNTKSTKIVYWNAQGLSTLAKQNQLIQFITSNNIEIVLLAETFFENNTSFNINGFCIYRKDRDSFGGGVAIAVKNNIAHKCIGSIETSIIENISIEVNINNSRYIVTAAYCPRYSKDFLKDIKLLTTNQNNFALFGDLNAHHHSWNCARNSKGGKELHDLQLRANFYILHSNTPTHFPGSNRTPSTIDLVLTNSDLNFSEIDASYQLPSDHNPIITSVQGKCAEIFQSPKFYYQKACWPKYQRLISNDLAQINAPASAKEADLFFQKLTSSMLMARELSIPKMKPRPNETVHQNKTTNSS